MRRFAAILLIAASLVLAACGSSPSTSRAWLTHLHTFTACGAPDCGPYPVTLNWDLTIAGLTGYNVYVNGNQVGTPTSSPYTFYGLDCGTTYTLGVQAHDGSGHNSGISTVPYTTPSCGGGGPPLSCDLNATTSTFASQVSAATPGQVVCLATGTYGAWSGTSKSAPGITITSAPGATVSIGLGDWSLGSVQNFTVDGTGGGGTMTVPSGAYDWSGSTTTARNITVRNVAWLGDLTIDGPTASSILLDHDSWNNSSCLINGGIRIHLSYGAGSPSGVTIQNSEFIGGSADGVQFGTAMNLLNNLFENVVEGADTQCHTDPIQPWFSGGVANIKGNWLVANADGIANFDPSTGTMDIENNVIDGTTENNALDIDADLGSTIMHNTIRNPANGVGIDLTSKSTQGPSSGTIIRDNIIQGATNPILLTGGGCSCTATPATNTNNMFTSGASSPNINGTPTYVNGTTFNAHDDYLLTSGSAGHLGGDDGRDIGTASIGAIAYGPQ